MPKDSYTHGGGNWYLLPGEEFGFKYHAVP